MTSAVRPGTLVFLHMPKAAGTTLQSIIGGQYAARSCFIISGNNKGVEGIQKSVASLRSLPLVKRDAIRCVQGHVPYGIGQWLRPPVTYITMLREPVARLVSDYNFAMSIPDSPARRLFGGRIISLEDFVDMRIERGLTNTYTLMLSGFINLDDFKELPVPTQVMLEAAKQNLNGFAGVGLTERFDESVLLFQRALGWSTCWYLRENVTGKQLVDYRRLSGDLLERVRSCIGFDLELYAHAVRLFETRILNAGPDFPQAVAAFQQANAVRSGRLLVARKLRSKLRRVGNLLRQTVSLRGR